MILLLKLMSNIRRHKHIPYPIIDIISATMTLPLMILCLCIAIRFVCCYCFALYYYLYYLYTYKYETIQYMNGSIIVWDCKISYIFILLFSLDARTNMLVLNSLSDSFHFTLFNFVFHKHVLIYTKKKINVF